MKNLIIVIFFSVIFLPLKIFALSNEKELYENSFQEIKDMLEGQQPISFKRAVYLTENAYLSNSLSYDVFNIEITKLAKLSELWLQANHLKEYNHEDSINFAKSGSLFKIFSDTIWAYSKTPIHYPFTYDFEDVFGDSDWTKMFVSKLLMEGKGNCHSLPYLYKIVADEIGVNTWLSFAPNHLYIKSRSKKINWFNTELTSGMFPNDGWIMASGYINRNAIINGIYMDTLSSNHSIAICLIDLAKGYEKKFKKKEDEFIIKCCKLALQYYPNYVNALLIKGNVLKARFDNKMKIHSAKHPSELFYISEAKETFTEMESTYATLVRLGYREIPKDTYLDWLTSLKREREKYENKKMTNEMN